MFGTGICEKHTSRDNTISRTWLRKSQFHFLDTIDNVNYKAYGKSVDEYHTDLYSCNARGGVALMVSKALCPYVTEIVIESNRLCGIEIKFPGEHIIFLIAVYLPAATQSYDSFSNELEYLMDIYRAYTQHGTVFLTE